MWTAGGSAPSGSTAGRALAAAGATAAALAAALAAAAAYQQRRRRESGDEERAAASGVGVQRLSFSKGIPLAEVALHTDIGSTWIVLHGQVYDVTSWLENHPGGKLLLIAFAGRDATEHFETVGHSALASRKLRQLHVGALCEGPPGRPLPAADRSDPRIAMRKATLTGGTRSALSGDNLFEANGCDASELWDVDEHGFLPCRDPVGIQALNGTAFEPFAELAARLPSMAVNGELRRHLDGSPDLQARLQRCGDKEVIDGMTEDQLERAFSVVGYTMVVYSRGGTLDYSLGVPRPNAHGTSSGSSSGVVCPPPSQLPNFLARPLLALSKHLGRPPMIDYASTVLYNWARIDPSGPISTTNIRCVLRMTSLLDEEWFFKTHVIIESEAAHAVAAVIAANQTEDDMELLQCLVSLEEAFWRVVRACLPIMYERSDDGVPKCNENMFYQILRPLIKSGPLVFECDDGPVEIALTGPSGAMSSLLPCIDAALGIQTTSPKLREALGAFEHSMPLKHRSFLADLRQKTSIRQRILLTRGVGAEYSEHHEALVSAYNRCISRVLDFRWQHWQYVKHFIMKPGNLYHAVGSGGTTFDYLQQHITDTEQARLTPRRDGFQRFLSNGSNSPELPIRMTPVAFQQPLEFWSVDGARGLLSRDPLTSPDGEWASGLPPAVRSAMKVLWDTAKCLPSLVAADGPVHAYVEELGDKLSVLQDDRMLLGLPEMARENLMSTLSHICAGCIGTSGLKKPPRCIDKPMQVVSRSLDRPPRLDFTDLVLTNWEVVAPASDSKDGQEQLGVVFRFLAIPDEECYRTLHILLHEEARDVIAAIRSGQAAISVLSDHDVISSVGRLSVWLNKFCSFFDAYFEQKDSRTESVMIRRLEPFVSRSCAHDLTWEETAWWVYWSGSSAILPAVQLFLGIKIGAEGGRGGGEEERSLASCMSQMLAEMRLAMPVAHRAFLEELDKPGASVRSYCIRRFGTKSVSVELLHDLEAAYNDALNAVLRYLARRKHLVLRFFPEFASSFGAFHAEVESYMRRSRLQLLKMRQRVHKALEATG